MFLRILQSSQEKPALKKDVFKAFSRRLHEDECLLGRLLHLYLLQVRSIVSASKTSSQSLGFSNLLFNCHGFYIFLRLTFNFGTFCKIFRIVTGDYFFFCFSSAIWNRTDQNISSDSFGIREGWHILSTLQTAAA